MLLNACETLKKQSFRCADLFKKKKKKGRWELWKQVGKTMYFHLIDRICHAVERVMNSKDTPGESYSLCPSNFRIMTPKKVFCGATWPLRTGMVPLQRWCSLAVRIRASWSPYAALKPDPEGLPPLSALCHPPLLFCGWCPRIAPLQLPGCAPRRGFPAPPADAQLDRNAETFRRRFSNISPFARGAWEAGARGGLLLLLLLWRGHGRSKRRARRGAALSPWRENPHGGSDKERERETRQSWRVTDYCNALQQL